MNYEKLSKKMSPISVVLLVWVASLALVLVSTPQHAIDFQNKFVYGPVVALAISLWVDLK